MQTEYLPTYADIQVEKLRDVVSKQRVVIRIARARRRLKVEDIITPIFFYFFSVSHFFWKERERERETDHHGPPAHHSAPVQTSLFSLKCSNIPLTAC